jgi:flagellar FliJ protein
MADRDERRADLAKGLRAETALLAQARELNQEQQDTSDLSRRLASPGEADIGGLLASHRYELVLKTRAKQLAEQITQVQSEVERRRQRLVEADRQVRVLEKLRDRRRAEHAAGEARSEQRQLDEQAILGFHRREATA